MNVFATVLCRAVGSAYNTALGSFPSVVRIETTNRCNAQCTICPHVTMTRKAGVMDEGLFRLIVDECAANGSRTLHLHNFGEPLLDPDLPARIRYAKGKGIKRVKMFTNGSVLTRERATALLDSGLDELKVSIDGANKTEYEQIRRGLKYDLVVNNIKEFVIERNKRGTTNPRVIAACCTTSNAGKSEDNLSGIVDKYSFGKVHNWGDQQANLPGPGAKPSGRVWRKPCSRLWRTMTILWNGDVSLCCLDYDGKVNLGNVSKDGSLRAIWLGEQYQRLRRLHTTGQQDEIGLCANCSKSHF